MLLRSMAHHFQRIASIQYMRGRRIETPLQTITLEKDVFHITRTVLVNTNDIILLFI